MTKPITRRTVALASLVTAVVAAIGIGFYALGRSTATPPPPTTNPTTAASAPTGPPPTPTYAPTDQNGSQEPGLPQGRAAASQGGSTTGPAGLPLGYARDQTGAANAATNYLMWMNSLRITDKTAADAMADTAAADPATRAALIESFDSLRSGMKELTADQPEPARGAYAVASYGADRALIYIWAPEVTTDVNGETTHLWAIDAVQLVWASNDWKLDQAHIAKTGAAAVDPSNPAGQPSAAEKHSILTRTPADPGAITDAADQSWLEYSNAPR
jgi:hypothetical protein